MADGIREILNEGRVAGCSAYELYVRKFYETAAPGAEPPTEQEWLASMFGSGYAMILKIAVGTTAGVQDFELPKKTALCGTNTIVASVFNGSCKWSSATVSATGGTGYWAEAVTSYGGLIQNNSEDHPTAGDIPYGDDIFDTSAAKLNVSNYCKIAEGLVIQQGEWEETGGEPYEDLKNPDLGGSPAVVRFYLTKDLTSDVCIILMGFMDKSFAETLSGQTGSTDPETNDRYNGGFLGPAIFPWSAKIIMTYPNMANLYGDVYTRQFPGDVDISPDTVGSYDFSKQDSSVNVKSILDFTTTDPGAYYNVNSQYSESTIPVKIEAADTAKDSINILATLAPGMTGAKTNAAGQESTTALKDAKFYPPALYALKANSNGTYNMVPVDVAAPGTLKMFDNADEAYGYVQQVPNTYAFAYNPSTGALQLFSSDSTTPLVPVINTSISVNGTRATISSGGKTVDTVALSDDEGTDYPVDGTDGVIHITGNHDEDGVSWGEILQALADNKNLDLLGEVLKRIRSYSHLEGSYSISTNFGDEGEIQVGKLVSNTTDTVGILSSADIMSLSRMGCSSIYIGNPAYDSTIDPANSARLGYDDHTSAYERIGKGLRVSGREYNNNNMSVQGNFLTEGNCLVDGNITTKGYISERVITETMSGGYTSVTLEDRDGTGYFTEDGLYDIYTSEYGVNPTLVTIHGSGNNCSVEVEFGAAHNGMTVGVVCRHPS